MMPEQMPPEVMEALSNLFSGTPITRPINTGRKNFLRAKSPDVQEAITVSARRVQDLYDEMRAELIAEIMVPAGDPEPLAEILDKMEIAAAEMAALLRK